MIESLLLPGLAGPRALVSETTKKTEDPSALRVGVVTVVTARGITVALANGSVGASHLDSYAPAVGDYCAMMETKDSWIALGRVVGPVTPTDLSAQGTGVGPSVLDAMGLTGTGTTLASSTGSEVTVPRYGVTYYHPPGHWVMLICGYAWYSSVANDWLAVRFKEAATSATIWSNRHIQAGNNFFGNSFTSFAPIPPSYGGAGHSIFMTVQRVSGSGTSRIDDSTDLGFMVALDMGDQSVFRTA